MRVITTAIQFDNAGNVVNIDRGLDCPKLDSRILIQCRVNWLAQGVYQKNATGQYVVSYGDGDVSIQRQYFGAYVNNQQYYDFEEIGYGVIHC